MRLAHISDPHVTEGRRFEITLNALDAAIAEGILAGVTLWLLTGDLWHHDYPHRHPTPLEQLALIGRVRRMLEQGDVVVVKGNHDVELAAALLELAGETHGHRVYVCERPRVLAFSDVSVVAVPYPEKRHLVAAAGAGAQELQRQQASLSLGQMMLGLVEACDPSLPIVVAAHALPTGSRLGGGELLAGVEIEFSLADVDALEQAGAAYIGVGHVHHPQQLSERAYVVGTLCQQTFGDTLEHGWNLVRVGIRACSVERIPTKAPRLLTTQALWTETGWQVEPVAALAAGDVVKAQAFVNESLQASADWALLEAMGYRVERNIVAESAARCPEIADVAASVGEAVELYWQQLTPAPAAEVLEVARAELATLEATGA